MTVEELKAVIENTISSLIDSGLEKFDPGMPDKITKLATLAGEAGMYEGKRLIDNLAAVMTAILEGKSTAESGKVRLTALEFYLEKIKTDAKGEHL